MNNNSLTPAIQQLLSNLNLKVTGLNALNEDELSEVVQDIAKLDSINISVKGGNIIIDMNDSMFLVDKCRAFVAMMGVFGVPQKKRRDVSLVAVRYNDAHGVIVDLNNNRVVGFIDADDVDLVNTLGVTMKTKVCTADGGYVNYRFNVNFRLNGETVTLPLSHVIYCYHVGYFPGAFIPIHHIKNSCDNSLGFLNIPQLHEAHPADVKCSDEYISHVIEKIADEDKITVYKFMDIIFRKALAERERICLKNRP